MNNTASGMNFQISQDRFAKCVAGALGASAQEVPHPVAERLRISREAALHKGRIARARGVEFAAAQALVVSGAGGIALFSHPAKHGFRIMSGLPFILLVAGLVLIHQWTSREQVLAAADVDSRLLADELPVRAYSDPGFAEFLKVSPP